MFNPYPLSKRVSPSQISMGWDHVRFIGITELTRFMFNRMREVGNAIETRACRITPPPIMDNNHFQLFSYTNKKCQVTAPPPQILFYSKMVVVGNEKHIVIKPVFYPSQQHFRHKCARQTVGFPAVSMFIISYTEEDLRQKEVTIYDYDKFWKRVLRCTKFFNSMTSDIFKTMPR